TYNDPAGGTAHIGMMVVQAQTQAALMDASVAPVDGHVYSVGDVIGTTGAQVAIFDMGDTGVPDGSDPINGLSTTSPTYVRAFHVDTRKSFSPGVTPATGLKLLPDASDGRVFSYAIGFASLAQASPIPGEGIYASTNNANGPVIALDTSGNELWRPPSQ